MKSKLFSLSLAALVLLVLSETTDKETQTENRCNHDLERVRNEPLIMASMLDSFGKPQSGLLRGATKWMGNYRQCIETSAPTAASGSEGFRGRYCTVQITINATSPSIGLQMGVCIPDTCNSDEGISFFRTKLLPIIEQVLAFVPKALQPYLNDIHLDSVDCLPLSTPFDGRAIVFTAFIALFLVVALVGTAIDVWDEKEIIRNQYRAYAKRDTSNDHNGEQKVNRTTNSTSTNAGSTVALAVEDEIIVVKDHENKQKVSMSKKILKCFSIYTNGRKMFETSKSTRGQLTCIHGLRFLSMTWIIAAHNYYFSVLVGGGVFSNIMDVPKDVNNLLFYTILNGTLSVDTFFVISGLLLCYLYMMDRDKRGPKAMNWILFYIHRYWRLTPVYMIILWMYVSVVHYLGSGPLWDYGDKAMSSMKCQKNWWYNLLYINNFNKMEEGCFMWSWYLADDFQFYAISPIFLLLLANYPRLGVASVSVTTLASWVTTWVITYINKYTFTLNDMLTANPETLPELSAQSLESQNAIYIKPYSRIGPYLIGFLGGYAIYLQVKNEYRIRRSIVITGWTLSIVLSLAALYGTFGAHLTPIEAAFNRALFRSAWGLGITWVIFACVAGYGGPVNKLLSANIWVPFSRLTYCAYLLHPIIMTIYYQNFQTTVIFSHSLLMLTFGGFFIVIYLFSVMFSLLFESSLLAIEKLVLVKK